MDGTGVSPPDPPQWSLSLELIGVSLGSLGRACACGPAPVLCLAVALTAGAHCAAAARVKARIAPAATNRTTLGRRLLIRFDGVSMLISLTGVAV
jgi:hypothetical protein